MKSEEKRSLVILIQLPENQRITEQEPESFQREDNQFLSVDLKVDLADNEE